MGQSDHQGPTNTCRLCNYCLLTSQCLQGTISLPGTHSCSGLTFCVALHECGQPNHLVTTTPSFTQTALQLTKHTPFNQCQLGHSECNFPQTRPRPQVSHTDATATVLARDVCSSPWLCSSLQHGSCCQLCPLPAGLNRVWRQGPAGWPVHVALHLRPRLIQQLRSRACC